MSSLQLKGVTVRARTKVLIEDISLSLREGEFVALIGPNGAGKTTLLRAALGLIKGQGDVLLNDKPVFSMSGRERAGVIGWLPQQALVSEPITAVQLVQAARYRFSETHANAEQEALSALNEAGAAEFAARSITQLSGGEQQRVAVAALIAQQSPLVLLDEPANHLDPAQQIGLYRLFGRLWRAGRGILCITHDINMLRHVGGSDLRVIGLGAGRIQFESSFAARDLPEKVGALFNVPMEVIEARGGRMLVPGGSA